MRVSGQISVKDLLVLRVVRRGDRHVVHDMSIDTRLELDATAATAPDPESVARAIHALAAHHAAGELELFATTITQHCLLRFAGVQGVTAEVRAGRWQRLDMSGRPRDRDLVGPAGETRVARAITDARGTRVSAGFRNLQLLTTGTDVPRSLLLLTLDALWTYGWSEIPFDTQWQQVRRALTEAYVERGQLTGAHLASALARAVLDETPAVHAVEVRLGTTRRRAVDMTAFGMENAGDVFGEPEAAHGEHCVTVEREELA